MMMRVQSNIRIVQLLAVIIISTIGGSFTAYGQAFTSKSNVCDAPPNPIVAENCKLGTGDWHLKNDYNDIEGYGSATSINLGESIDFFINTRAPSYDLTIYRSGYYGGSGGRLMQAAKNLPGHDQPACHDDRQTGLTSCSNWSISYHLIIPNDWVSGVYLVKLVRPDTGGENYILFVVRNDSHPSDIILQLSTNTYEAYSFYGNKCFYSSISPDYCPTISGARRAVKVSYDRPDILPYYSQDSYFWTDYPVVNWLEAQGYDIGYITNMDTHRYGKPGSQNKLLDHRLFLSVGHDEYWTQEMRDAVTAARDSGVHLGFFSSNVSYWRTRMEPDPWSGKPDRVIVCYKTAESGSPDPSGQATTTWRDPQGANNPENSLLGVQYVGDNNVIYFPLRVTAELAKDRIYRNTGLQDMPTGTYIDIGKHLIGWEWDSVVDNGKTPKNLTVLAVSPVYGELLQDAGRKYLLGKANAYTTRYTAPSGAIVFASGTNLWGWGLAVFEPDRRIQQITYNLLADMGIQPVTPIETLILDNSPANPSPPEVIDHSIGYDPWIALPIEKRIRVWAVPDFKFLVEDLPRNANTSEFKPLEPAGNLSIKELKVNQITFDSAVLSWTTNRPANGQAWVSLTPGIMDWSLAGKSMLARPVTAMVAYEAINQAHALFVSDLLPDTVYYFQTISMEPSGKVAISEEQSFRTLSGGPLLMQVKNSLRPLYRQVICLYASYKGLFFGLGSVLMFAVLFAGWKGLKDRK